MDSIQIFLEEFRESQHEVLDILQWTPSSWVALPLVGSCQIHLSDSCTIPPKCKQANNRYYFPSSDSEFLFTHLTLNSLLVNSVNKCEMYHQVKATLSDEDQKHLDLFSRRTYSSTILKFRIKLSWLNAVIQNITFIEYLLADKCDQFPAVINEAQVLAAPFLDAAYTKHCNKTLYCLSKLSLFCFPQKQKVPVNSEEFSLQNI